MSDGVGGREEGKGNVDSERNIIASAAMTGLLFVLLRAFRLQEQQLVPAAARHPGEPADIPTGLSLQSFCADG